MPRMCVLGVVSVAVMTYHDCDQKQLEEEKDYFSF